MHHEQQCTIGYFPDPSTDKKYTKYQISITSNSSPVLPSTTQCIIIPFPAPATAVHNITYNQYLKGHYIFPRRAKNSRIMLFERSEFLIDTWYIPPKKPVRVWVCVFD